MRGTRTENGGSHLAWLTYQLVFLVCFLCVVPSAPQGSKITCSVPSVYPHEDTVLMCHFPEDVLVSKKDFTVYHNVTHNGSEAVLDCWWYQGHLDCYTKPGYEYDKTVGRNLNLTFRQVTKAQEGTYYCQVFGYGSNYLETCELNLKTVSAEEENYKTIVLVLVIVPGVLALSVLLWYKLYYKRRRRLNGGDSETHTMIRINEKSKQVTEKLEKFLLQNARGMYTDMLDDFYFVPPVYFNKLRYTTQSVVGQVVYIPDPPHDSDVRHDRAMKHVLHCLHHMAEQGQEDMFVLTQFNYNDYLNNPGKKYKNHHLPVLGGLKIKTKDKNIDCFDVLIIHRQHGVVIGVVKSLSDKDDCSQDGGRETDVKLAKDISEGIERLMKADRVIQHFMSDQQHSPPVRLTLMLPNVTRSTLQRALDNHTDVAQNLCECMKATEATQLCLCADEVSNALPPWEVYPSGMSHLSDWWGHLMKGSVEASTMSDEVYQTMIARFCGEATSCGSNILRGSNINHLPKTLNQSVFVTGDLFERLTLYPGMVELLDRPRMLLTGPPATGKSRMLALVGRKWISEGHSVYIINTTSDGGAATIQLKMLMQEAPSKRRKSTKEMVIPLFCRIEDDEKIYTAIKTLIADASTRKIPIFAVIDELGNDLAKSRQSAAFLQKLLQLPDFHLWAATCNSDILPDGCDGRNLTELLSCPPSIVKEAQRYVIPGMTLYTSSNFQQPTNGLPVKNIHHQSQGHEHREPRDCKLCAKIALEFLKACLHDAVSDACDATANGNPTNDKETWRQHRAVKWKDIWILFESDFTEDVPLMKYLRKSGIPVQIISNEIQEKILTSDSNTMLAAKAVFLCGLKRKVVVYVEGFINGSDDSAKWTRVRSITSCTSQLVVIRMF